MVVAIYLRGELIYSEDNDEDGDFDNWEDPKDALKVHIWRELEVKVTNGKE